MTAWSEMSPVEFDLTLLAGKRAREFVASAGDTLFPRLMPDPKSQDPAPAEPMPGQDEIDLFGGTP